MTERSTALCIRLVTIDAWQGAEQLHDVDMTIPRSIEQGCFLVLTTALVYLYPWLSDQHSDTFDAATFGNCHQRRPDPAATTTTILVEDWVCEPRLDELEQPSRANRAKTRHEITFSQTSVHTPS